MKKIALFASGSGSNALKLIQIKDELKNCELVKVITDKENAGIISKCRDMNFPLEIIPKNSTKLDHEQKILSSLKKDNIDWILLAGYMRILSSDFIQDFYDKDLNQSRIINIHPSLLPKYQGLHAFERCFESNDEEGGITLHFVDAGVDTGKIITQEKFKKQGTLEAFIQAGQKIEHKIYPAFLKRLDKYIETNNIRDLYP